MRTVVHTEKEVMEEVIRQCEICFVGMADTDGTPYVIPMNFGYRDGVVYLHSAPHGKSLDILKRNPLVCITFCGKGEIAFQDKQVACSYGMRAKSVIGYGKVEFEEDMEGKREILDIFMGQYSKMKFKYGDPAVRNVKVWKVPLDTMTCREFGAPYRQ
ncbi:MAG: pyridoxamine 5'-phosphate oxidase family protein [Tannerellaceae bacterium]|nr:pyridoxamine 5'-phosphate oxidase family protein [Tannerellaceae bacterium]